MSVIDLNGLILGSVPLSSMANFLEATSRTARRTLRIETVLTGSDCAETPATLSVWYMTVYAGTSNYARCHRLSELSDFHNKSDLTFSKQE